MQFTDKMLEIYVKVTISKAQPTFYINGNAFTIIRFGCEFTSVQTSRYIGILTGQCFSKRGSNQQSEDESVVDW